MNSTRELTKEEVCKYSAIVASFVDGGIERLKKDDEISTDTYKMIDEVITVAQVAITLYCNKKG